MNLITKKLERFKSPTALAIMSQFNSKYIYIPTQNPLVKNIILQSRTRLPAYGIFSSQQ
jgi:hypothetical protein